MYLSRLLLSSLLFAQLIEAKEHPIVPSCHSGTTCYEGTFVVRRKPDSCSKVTATVRQKSVGHPHCYMFSFAQLRAIQPQWLTYKLTETGPLYNMTYGLMTATGQFPGYDLYFPCPPYGYNNFIRECLKLTADTVSVILTTDASDGKLLTIDVTLSGAPYPDPATVMNNEPPFGLATFEFPGGIDLQHSGYLQICQGGSSSQCEITQKIAPAFPTMVSEGSFDAPDLGITVYSKYVLDAPNKFLILEYDFERDFYNASGYYAYKTIEAPPIVCKWYPLCSYDCQTGALDSRYYDFMGTWIVTHRLGVPVEVPVKMTAWGGSPIVAAGFFPGLAYFNASDVPSEAFWIGMDIASLGPFPYPNGHWYPKARPILTKDFTDYVPVFRDYMGCGEDLCEWSGNQSWCRG